jgi:3-mercaptopyruvate sulfurtransferase SseA
MAGGVGKWIVETAWLAAHLDDPDVVIVDGSMHLPTANRDAKTEYLAQHIPGAAFFDINDIADEASPLPHMLPSPAKFAGRVTAMGIGDGVRVVAYDSEGLYSAARVWWMCRAERRPQEMEGRGASSPSRGAPFALAAPVHPAFPSRARAPCR